MKRIWYKIKRALCEVTIFTMGFGIATVMVAIWVILAAMLATCGGL